MGSSHPSRKPARRSGPRAGPGDRRSGTVTGFFSSFGDVWRLYMSPGEGGLGPVGFTAVVPVTNRQKLLASYLKFKESAPKDHEGAVELRSLGFAFPIEHFRFAEEDVYCANSISFAPAWCLTSHNELVMALSPQNIKAYLSHGNRHKPISRIPPVAGLFADHDRLVALGYVDTPKVFGLVYPWISFCNPMIVSAMRMRAGLPGEVATYVDLSLLPSAPAIGRHLEPDLITVRRTNDGIEWTVRKTIPGMDLTALTAAAFLWRAYPACFDAPAAAAAVAGPSAAADALHARRRHASSTGSTAAIDANLPRRRQAQIRRRRKTSNRSKWRNGDPRGRPVSKTRSCRKTANRRRRRNPGQPRRTNRRRSSRLSPAACADCHPLPDSFDSRSTIGG